MNVCDGYMCPLAYHCKRRQRLNEGVPGDSMIASCYESDQSDCPNFISIKERICAECAYFGYEYCNLHQEAGIEEDELACSQFVSL